MRIVCISDTHGHQDHFPVPDGDVLIHAGDFVNRVSTERSMRKFTKWLHRLPHKWKVLVAGNHDELFQKQPELARDILGPGCIYLQDTGCEIEGLRIWGSPWQPWFHGWAFNLQRRGPEIREKWGRIPQNIDVLITHTPPFGILDHAGPHNVDGRIVSDSKSVGCEELAARLRELRPRLHVFGHMHGGHGCLKTEETMFVNASICDEEDKPTNRAFVVDLVP